MAQSESAIGGAQRKESIFRTALKSTGVGSAKVFVDLFRIYNVSSNSSLRSNRHRNLKLTARNEQTKPNSMAINNYTGQTFVAFLDISGFKELMRKDKDALEALRRLYQAGYDVLSEQIGVEGFFVSDSGILFVRDGSSTEKLKSILTAIKSINKKMLRHGYMLTTSIAYGAFDYHGKLEFDGIEKNPIYGFAYVQAFLDNEKGQPKIQPGQCRVIKQNFPEEINLAHADFEFLKERGHDNKHLYFYWNVQHSQDIEDFEQHYTDSYKLKYEGMLQALKRHDNHN